MAGPFDIAWNVLKGDPRLRLGPTLEDGTKDEGSIHPVVAQMIDRRVQSGEIEPTNWNDFMGRSQSGSYQADDNSTFGRLPGYKHEFGGYNQDRVPLAGQTASVGKPKVRELGSQPTAGFRQPDPKRVRWVYDDEGKKRRRVFDIPTIEPMVDSLRAIEGDEETLPPPAGSDQEMMDQSSFFDKFKTDAGTADERGYRESHPRVSERQRAIKEARDFHRRIREREWLKQEEKRRLEEKATRNNLILGNDHDEISI